MRLIRLPISIAGATLLFAGCPDDTTTTGLSGGDVAAETSADGTVADVTTDATPDATPDAAVDATPDQGSPDVVADAAVDAVADQGTPDVQLDAADDTALDAQSNDGTIADATADGIQSDGGSGDATTVDAAQDAGKPDADAGKQDAVADATVDAAQDTSQPDAKPDADLDASADSEVTCWTPDDQEIQELVGHPCEVQYEQKGFCNDSNELIVGCTAGTWTDGATIGSFGFCNCASFGGGEKVCGPEDYFCAAIGYVGIARAGQDREHGGLSLRVLS